jgi:nitrite reductase/ring-hydroxylating ferredoxin subunit
MGINIGGGGIVNGNCIECPFHQWRFSGETGECVDIPYSEGGEGKNILYSKYLFKKVPNCSQKDGKIEKMDIKRNR